MSPKDLLAPKENDQGDLMAESNTSKADPLKEATSLVDHILSN